MSIPNIFNKIKSKFGIDKATFLYFCIIILVGTSAFGLGRLSVDRSNNPVLPIIIEQTVSPRMPIDQNQPASPRSAVGDNQTANRSPIVAEKQYVASKNGKLYYSLGCKAANRIKPENEVWFSSAADAEKSGYSPSTSCQ